VELLNLTLARVKIGAFLSYHYTPLIFLGNSARSPCGTAAFGQEIGSKTAEIAKFPVNYPVSREISVETGSYLTARTTKFSIT
jgi:hypothetical protein